MGIGGRHGKFSWPRKFAEAAAVNKRRPTLDTTLGVAWPLSSDTDKGSTSRPGPGFWIRAASTYGTAPIEGGRGSSVLPPPPVNRVLLGLLSEVGNMSVMVTDISALWTDEEACMCLYEVQQNGSLFPSNVLADVDPFNRDPAHLPPGEFWYIVGKGEKKKSEIGIWKVRGEPSQIFSNSSIVGFRTTLEFYKGQAPNVCKTDWLMQEYTIIQKGACENRKLEELSSLCRIFLSGGQNSSHESRNLTAADGAVGSQVIDIGSVASEAKSNSGQEVNSRSQLQGKLNAGTTLVAGSERNMRRDAENLVEMDDFLEMDDLVSSSFSSENSTLGTMSSDGYFDSSALLRELDTEIKEDPQQKGADCKFNVFASHHPNKVVLRPPQSESLSSSGDRGKVVANGVTKADPSPPGLATKDNSRIKKATVPVGRSKQAVAHCPPAGSATKSNLLTDKASSGHETKTKPKEKAASSGVKASSSASVVPKRGNMRQKRKCWIKNLCFFPF